MKQELKAHLKMTLDAMDNTFSSNEFANHLRTLGDYSKFIAYGGLPSFLRKHCKNHTSIRSWIKKNLSVADALNQHAPQIFDIKITSDKLDKFTPEELVAHLRRLGYTVTCKKITEVEI